MKTVLTLTQDVQTKIYLDVWICYHSSLLISDSIFIATASL